MFKPDNQEDMKDRQKVEEYLDSCSQIIALINEKKNIDLSLTSNLFQSLTKLLEIRSPPDQLTGKIIETLTSSSYLVRYCFQNNNSQIYFNLKSIFDPNQPLYINNRQNIWAVVVDNFIQSNILESIINKLENEKNSPDCFQFLASILNFISSRIQTHKYQSILKQIITILSSFLTETNNYSDDDFFQLCSAYFNLCSHVINNPDDFDIFVNLLDFSFRKKEERYEDFGCQQILNLINTPAKTLLMTIKYRDFIFAHIFSEENTKRLTQLYILFSQSHLFDLKTIEFLNNKRSIILDCCSQYIEIDVLETFVQNNIPNAANLSLFIQFSNHSKNEQLSKLAIHALFKTIAKN